MKKQQLQQVLLVQKKKLSALAQSELYLVSELLKKINLFPF
jgi:hypothetical protein